MVERFSRKRTLGEKNVFFNVQVKSKKKIKHRGLSLLDSC